MRIGILTEKNGIIDGEIRFKVVPQRLLRIAVIRQHGKAVTLPYTLVTVRNTVVSKVSIHLVHPRMYFQL